MAINPSRIFENELQARGLRATNAAGWAAAGIDTVTDELIRAGFTEIGRLIGQSGITNRAVIFQILCAALAKLGEYPIAGKLIAETIDDMNLPWLEFAVRAIAGAGVGLHQTLDQPGSTQFDVSEMLMPHLPSDVQEEVELTQRMRREDIPKLLAAFTDGVVKVTMTLMNLIGVDKSDELEADTEGLKRMVIMAIRVEPALVDKLPTLDLHDETVVSELLDAAREAEHCPDAQLKDKLNKLRRLQTGARKTLNKFSTFLLLCEIVGKDLGLLGATSDLKDMILGKWDDFNTLERRIRAKRLAAKAPAFSLAAGKVMVWNFWILIVGILFSLGATLYGYLGIFTELTEVAEGTEAAEQVTQMAWAWGKYWLLVGIGGGVLGALALMKSAPITLRPPWHDGALQWPRTVDDRWSVQWTPLLVGAATAIFAVVIHAWWPSAMQDLYGDPNAPGHTYWRASMRWGCLLTLGVFVYGAAAVEPIMNGLRNLLSGLFGADSFVRRFAESFLEGVADHTTQTRGAVAAVLGARSVISGKITARLVMIAAIPFFSDLTYGWTESWYMDHSLFDWADFVRGVMVVITLAIIGVWGFLAIGIRTGSRPYLMPNPDIAQIGEQTLAMDRWISKAGIVTVIGLVIVPVLLCGWAKVKMEYEGSKVASARFDHISDCEDLGSDHEEYDTCLLMVMNKSETEQAELAIVAERTRARQAKKSKVAEAE